MHLFKCTNRFDLVINVLKNKCICLKAQIHMSLNRIVSFFKGNVLRITLFRQIWSLEHHVTGLP